MNTKTLKILLVVTLIVVLAAVVAQRATRPGAGGESLPERVLPGLAEQINDVASIKVAGGGKELVLERRDGSWVVASMAGYPAKFETVKEAIVSLTELKPLERKTADPTRYGRIGVEEPSPEGESVRIVLRDGPGGEIASAVLGASVTAGGSTQRYIRAGADPQAWLAEGRVNVPTDPMQWVEREILRLPRDRITRVMIVHPDGEAFSITREQGGSGYTLERVPEGRSAKGPGEIGAPASALSYLRFDDVRSEDEPGFDRGEPVVAVFEADNGLKVTALTWQDGDQTWASFAADAPEAPGATEESLPAESGEEASDADEPSGAAEEAAALATKLGGWLFAIPEYQAGSLRKRLDDLTEEPGAEESETSDEIGEQPVFVPTIDAKDDSGGGI